MECKTGNPLILTKAFILLNVFHHFSCHTETIQMVHNKIPFFEFLLLYSFMSVNGKANSESPARLTLFSQGQKKKKKSIILFLLAPHKSKFNARKWIQKSVGFKDGND